MTIEPLGSEFCGIRQRSLDFHGLSQTGREMELTPVATDAVLAVQALVEDAHWGCHAWRGAYAGNRPIFDGWYHCSSPPEIVVSRTSLDTGCLETNNRAFSLCQCHSTNDPYQDFDSLQRVYLEVGSLYAFTWSDSA